MHGGSGKKGTDKEGGGAGRREKRSTHVQAARREEDEEDGRELAGHTEKEEGGGDEYRYRYSHESRVTYQGGEGGRGVIPPTPGSGRAARVTA